MNPNIVPSGENGIIVKTIMPIKVNNVTGKEAKL